MGDIVPFYDPHRDSVAHEYLHNTYGVNAPSDITALEALLDDIRRTHSHILWLENYIATNLTKDSIFQNMAQDQLQEHEITRYGKPTPQGHPAYQLEINRKRQQKSQTIKQSTHPAIKELQTERHHLVQATSAAIGLGIKLDNMEFTRQQADKLILAITRFALLNKLDPADPKVQQTIFDALLDPEHPEPQGQTNGQTNDTQQTNGKPQ
jgi:hypothetical protein